MPSFEYKVVPAPKRAAKIRGIKGTDGRFAQVIENVMNAMGADGWEYQRTDTLPCEERVGLTGPRCFRTCWCFAARWPPPPRPKRRA